jgi:serine/threonine protein kinase
LHRVANLKSLAEEWPAISRRLDEALSLLPGKIALKLPHIGWAPGLAARMARERDILASLEHPNIARLYDAGVGATLFVKRALPRAGLPATP